MIQTDLNFQNLAQQGFDNLNNLGSLIDDKIKFFNDYSNREIDESKLLFEGWHHLSQIYILEYLMNLPSFSQHFQSKQESLKKIKENYNQKYFTVIGADKSG